MRFKKQLLLSSSLVLIVFIACLPSILAFSGTIYPIGYSTLKGSYQEGSLSSFRRIKDRNVIIWEGESYAPWWWEIEVRTWFSPKSDVGINNELEWRFKFTGGGSISVKIIYTDETYDTYGELQTGGTYHTVTYEIDDDKSVFIVRFYNLEWWLPGKIYIDYLAVHYT